MNTANVMRINAEETNMRELCDSIPLGPMSEYERGFIDGNQTQGEEHMNTITETLHALDEVKKAIQEAYASGYSNGRQRTWVGLTPEETDDIIANAIDKVDALIQTADKLKEKNT